MEVLRWLLHALLRCESMVVADVRAGAHCSSAQYRRSPHAPPASGGHGVPGRSSLRHMMRCSGHAMCHCKAGNQGIRGRSKPMRQQARCNKCKMNACISHECFGEHLGQPTG